MHIQIFCMDYKKQTFCRTTNVAFTSTLVRPNLKDAGNGAIQKASKEEFDELKRIKCDKCNFLPMASPRNPQPPISGRGDLTTTGRLCLRCSESSNVHMVLQTTTAAIKRVELISKFGETAPIKCWSMKTIGVPDHCNRLPKYKRGTPETPRIKFMMRNESKVVRNYGKSGANSAGKLLAW